MTKRIRKAILGNGGQVAASRAMRKKVRQPGIDLEDLAQVLEMSRTEVVKLAHGLGIRVRWMWCPVDEVQAEAIIEARYRRLGKRFNREARDAAWGPKRPA